jgi:nucleoside-diphosphate-sugar epimerase
MHEWLPAVAAALGARRPLHLPAVVARAAVGEWGVAFTTQLRGADNTRAKRCLGWRPANRTWRTGLLAELAAAPGEVA